MGLKGYYLLPHPPIVLPEVGRGEEEKISITGESFNKIAKEISQKSPKTIIVITPHGTMFQDAISLSYEEKIYGDLKAFGVDHISMDFSINKDLTDKIYQLAQEDGIPVIKATNSFLNEYDTSVTLDHGAIIPCYFINKYYRNYQLVHITYAPLSDRQLYKFGMVIAKAIGEREDAIIIASGDLSHKLKSQGPYEYDPMGPKFDKEFIGFLAKGNVMDLLAMDKEMIYRAGECGRRSTVILLGSLEGKSFKGECLSYEDTFGVGYGVMKFTPLGEGKSVLDRLESMEKALHEKKLSAKDPYVRLARESLTHYLETGEYLKNIPVYVSKEMESLKRGVFVSLKKHGELRGCIGTIFPTTENIAREIIRNAIEAGIYDPRFYEVEREELPDIDFSVDVLTEPKGATIHELDSKRYGVIVKSKGKTGLLLPDLEGVDTVNEQLSIALKKAGISIDDEYSIEKFEVIRHKED